MVTNKMVSLYEKYKTEWMLEHGITMDEFIRVLDNYRSECEQDGDEFNSIEIDKMVFLFNESKNDLQPVSDDETWCEAAEASVVCSGENYYRHNWKIDEFEV